MSINSKMIQSKIDRINRHSDIKEKIEIDTNAAGFRITNRNGSHDVSPRLSALDMLIWLQGFESGLDYRYVEGE